MDLTALDWALRSIVVTIRRPPLATSWSVRPMRTSSFFTSDVM